MATSSQWWPTLATSKLSSPGFITGRGLARMIGWLRRGSASTVLQHAAGAHFRCGESSLDICCYAAKVAKRLAAQFDGLSRETLPSTELYKIFGIKICPKYHTCSVVKVQFGSVQGPFSLNPEPECQVRFREPPKISELEPEPRFGVEILTPAKFAKLRSRISERNSVGFAIHPFRSHETGSVGIAPEMAECMGKPELLSCSGFGSVQRRKKILESRTELWVQVRGFIEPEPELCVRFSPVQRREAINTNPAVYRILNLEDPAAKYSEGEDSEDYEEPDEGSSSKKQRPKPLAADPRSRRRTPRRPSRKRCIKKGAAKKTPAGNRKKRAVK
ncbi:hypothetical protein C8J57DRAFT_1224111 [Mycena rebaudengoi]|nr:hypothetical protein C8J57DRAFT_1224111 [Mycena rebaudengoi]